MSQDLQTEESKQTVSALRLVIVGVLWSLPWAQLALTFLSAPNYISPIFANKIAGGLVIGMILWESAGCILLARNGHWLVWIAVILFCIGPALLLPLLPAVLTIIQALGPAFN